MLEENMIAAMWDFRENVTEANTSKLDNDIIRWQGGEEAEFWAGWLQRSDNLKDKFVICLQ